MRKDKWYRKVDLLYIFGREVHLLPKDEVEIDLEKTSSAEIRIRITTSRSLPCSSVRINMDSDILTEVISYKDDIIFRIASCLKENKKITKDDVEDIINNIIIQEMSPEW